MVNTRKYHLDSTMFNSAEALGKYTNHDEQILGFALF